MWRFSASFIALSTLFAASALSAQDAEPSLWSDAQIGELRHLAADAGADALPCPDTQELETALAGGDRAAIDRAATALALDLARLHLFGSANVAQRSGWHVHDSDAELDLPALLAKALAGSGPGAFLAPLRPQAPDYAVLRDAYAAESDPARRDVLARNMERWRWLPHELGAQYVLVNTAAFDARLWRGGAEAGRWKVIVGKTATPTPVFDAKITGITVNPWWNVPASIVRESVGGLVRRNPSLARARGYVWSDGRIRQKPGPGNALGVVKIEMPNPYTVYMHDTNARQLFERDVRALSHGCMRTDDALGYATTLLNGLKSREELEAVVETRRTTTYPLPQPIPVYVTYFTAATRADGTLGYFDDIYGRDRRMGFKVPTGEGCGE